MTRHKVLAFLSAFFVALILIGFAQPVSAAVLTWNGAGGATWNTASTNWSSVSVGTPWDSINGPSYVADFNTAGATPTVSGTVNTNGITFGNTATITGGTINLVGTTPTLTLNASGTINSAITGTAGLTEQGTGTLTLTAANTYSGGTTVIGSSILTINTAAALGSGPIFVGDQVGTGGRPALYLANGVNLSGVSLTLASSSAGGRGYLDGQGTNSFNGSITLSGNGTTGIFANGALFTVSGSVTGAGNSSMTLFMRGTGTGLMQSNINIGGETVTVTDAATWTLSSNGNTWGNTTVANGTLKMGAVNALPAATVVTIGQSGNSGTLDLNGNSQQVAGLAVAGGATGETITNLGSVPATLTVSATTAYTYGGGIANGSNPLNLVVTGPGSLTLTNATNTYTGSTTVSGGALLTVYGASDTALGNVPTSPTTDIFLNNGQITNYSNMLTLSASRNISISGTGYLDPGWGGGKGITVNGQIFGAGNLGVPWDTGTLVLNGSNGYQGSTTIGTTGNSYYNNSGANPTVQLGNSNALPGGDLIFGSDALNNTATLDMHGFNATVGALTGGANAVVDIVSGGGASTLTVGNNNATSVFSGLLKNTSGTLALTKVGTGTVMVNSSNTFTGALTLNGGVFATNNINTVGTAQGMGQSGKINLNGGAFRYTGANFPTTADSAGQFNPTITVGASGGTLDNNTSGAYVEFDGALSGGGALNLVDSSLNNHQWLITSGNPGFSGSVSIGNGSGGSGFVQYRSANASPLGTGTVTINAGGSLSADNPSSGGGPSTLANPIVLNGGLLCTQTPVMTYSGPITANVGTVSTVGWGGNDVLLTGNLTGSGTVTTGVGAYSVKLAGTNSGFAGTWQSTTEQTWFTNAAAGSPNAIWVANGSNFVASVSGTNSISLGALTGSSGNLNNALAGSLAIFSIGALNTNSTFSGTIFNNAGTTGLTKVGTGTLGLSGSNITFTGATNVSSGTLALQDTTAFASPISVGAGGTLDLVRSSTGFASRRPIAGNAITGSGVINVNNAGTGLAGGWVGVTGASAMNFSGTINVNAGVFGTDSSGVITGSAIVNVAPGGVFTNHSSAGVTIGALNGGGDVTPAQTNNGVYNLTLGAGDKSGSFAGIIHGNNGSGGTGIGDGTMEAGYLSLTKTGSGMQVLGGANTYTGATSINGGTLAVNGSLAAGSAVTVGAAGTLAGSGVVGGNVTLNGGTVNLSSSGQLAGTLGVNGGAWNGPGSVAGLVTTNSGAFNIGSGANLAANGGVAVNGGTLAVNGLVTPVGTVAIGAAGTLAGSGTVSGNTTLSGGVVNLSSGGQLAGVLSVTGGAWNGQGSVNGLVTASNGVFAIGNGANLAANSGLNLTGGTLTNVGTVSGGTVAWGSAAMLAPGVNATPGILTLPSLATNGGGTLFVGLAATNDIASNDSVVVTGNLSLGGTTTIVPSLTGGVLATGSPYTLFNYSGTLNYSGSPLVLAAGILALRQAPTFNYGAGANSAVTLTINGFNANLTWVGTNSTTWVDNTGILAWTSPTSPTGDFFTAQDAVTFDNTAGTNTTITLSGIVAPSAITVTGTNNFTFSGSGSIGNGSTLTVAGPGSLCIATTGNTFSGGTVIAGGTLVLGANNALPTGGVLNSGRVTLGSGSSSGTLDLAGFNQTVSALAVAASATAANQIIGNSLPSSASVLTFNGGGPSNFAGTIQDGIGGIGGQVGLTVAGGLLTLSGTNAYSGVTAVNGGTLQLGSASALYSGAAANNVSVGGLLDLGGYNAGIAGLSGTGTVLTSGGAATLTVGNNNASNTFTGSLQNGGGTLGLTKTGSGTQVLIGANTYSGGTTISGGVLQLGDGTTNGTFGAGLYNIGSATTLRLSCGTAVASPAWADISGAGTVDLRSSSPVNGSVHWADAALPAGFTGKLQIEAGRIYVGTPAALGNATAVAVSAGGQLAVWNGGVFPQNLTIAGQGYGEAGWESAVRLGNANLTTTLSGSVTLSANATIGAAGQGTGVVAGVLSGSSTANLTIGTSQEVGTIALANANTFSGNTTVVDGTLKLSNSLALQNSTLTSGGIAFDPAVTSHAFTFGGLGGWSNLALNDTAGTAVALTVGNNNAGTTYGGVLSGPGSLTKSGSGVLTLIGNSSYNGPTTISGGTLRLQPQPGVAGFGGNGVNWTVQSAGISSTPIAANVLTLTDNNTGEARSAWYDAPVYVAAGFTASFTYTPSGSKAADGVTFTVQNAANPLQQLGGGGGGLGYGNIPSSGAAALNIYTGAASGVGSNFVSGGNSPANLANQSVSPVVLNSGDPINVTLTYNPTAQTFSETLVDGANSKTLTFNGVNFPSLLGGPTGYLGFTGADGGATATQTISNFVFSGGPGNNVLPAGTALQMASGTVFDMTGVNQTIASLADAVPGATTGHQVLLGNGTLTVGDSASTTFSGVISGVGGNLTKVGTGTLVLSGSSNYSGGTTLANGTLVVTNAASLGAATGNLSIGSGTLQVAAGFSEARNIAVTSAASTIQVNPSVTYGNAGTVSGNGRLNVIGGGTLELAGSSAIASSVNVSDNTTFQVDGAVSAAGMNVNDSSFIAGAGTLTFSHADIGLQYNSSMSSTFSGTIAGSGPVEVAGSGALTLTGAANTYSGGTNVDFPYSRLTVGAAGALPAGTAATINGTLDLGGFNVSVDTLGGTGALDNLSGGGNTLTIGSNGGSSTFAGAIQNTVGPLAVYKTGSGTLTLAGPSTYVGGTTMNAGMLVAANGAAGSALGLGTLTLNGGTLTAGQAGGTVSGPVQAGNALHTIAPGAGLASGYGTLNLNGGLSTNANTTLAFNLNLNTPSNGIYIGDLINLGGSALNVSGGSITFVSDPATQGDYRLFTGVGGTPNVNALSLPTAPNGDAYSLSTSVDPGNLDLVVGPSVAPTSFSLSASLDQSRIMVSSSATLTGRITNSGSASSDLLNFNLGASISSGSGSLGALSSSSGTGLALNATLSASAVFTAGTTPGPVTLSLSATATNATLGGSAGGTTPINASLDVVANRAVTSTSASLGLVHVGEAVTPQSLTLSTTGDDGQYTRVTVTNSGIDSNGFLAVSGGSTGTVFNGSGVTDNRVVSGTPNAAGIFNGSITLTTSGEGLVNESPVNVLVSYTAAVFSGSGRWNGGNGSTSWGSRSSSNWTDVNGQGVQAAPGTFAGFADTAVLDDTGGTNTTVTLDGASPMLAALIFSTTGGGSYTVAQGSGGTLNLSNGANAAATVVVSNGTHAITAPIMLSSSGSFAPALGTQLTLAGNIGDGSSGSMALALTDSGTLILSGTANSYSGGTYVDVGTLIVNNSGAIQDGSSLTVGANGMFLFDPTATGAALDAASARAATRINPVPEPGTLALFAAALSSATIYRRFRRRKAFGVR